MLPVNMMITVLILFRKKVKARHTARMTAPCQSCMDDVNKWKPTTAIIETDAALSPSRKSLSFSLLRAEERILCRKKEIKNEGRKIPAVASTPPVVPLIR